MVSLPLTEVAVRCHGNALGERVQDALLGLARLPHHGIKMADQRLHSLVAVLLLYGGGGEGCEGVRV